MAAIIELKPNEPGAYEAGMRDVLDYLQFRRDETREWREQNPLAVRFERAYRDGQWDAIQLACTTIENRFAPSAEPMPSDVEIDAAAVAMYFRNVMPVSQESIELFKRSDAWPVWREQARAGLIAAAKQRG